MCVQGLVTLYDVTEESGGLCVIPGSHQFHEEVVPRSASSKLRLDYVAIATSDEVLQKLDGIVVGASAGDMIVWDSRTIHCNTSATSEIVGKHYQSITDMGTSANDKVSSYISSDAVTSNCEIIRLVGYVCMLPRRTASRECLSHRKYQFRNYMRTSHWPIVDGDDLRTQHMFEDRDPDVVPDPVEIGTSLTLSMHRVFVLHLIYIRCYSTGS